MFKRLLFKSKRKKPLKTSLEKKVERTSLELICADDPEAYEVLRDTMLFNPRLIKESIEEAAKKRDFFTAGQLALYAGDVEKVKKYFELSGRKLKILEIPERAVKKAQQYYAEQTKKK